MASAISDTREGTGGGRDGRRRAADPAREWVAGARPKTLPAAVAPVAVGTGAAYEIGGAVAWKALLCLVVALALQVGRQLRQRLLRRGARHRRRPGRPAAAGRVGGGGRAGGQAGGVRGVRGGRRGRAGAGGDEHVVVPRDRGGGDRGGLALHRGAAAVRVRRARRGVRVRLLRAGRGARHDVGAGRRGHAERDRGRRRVRAAGRRGAGGQQPARPAARRQGRQAHARGAPGRRADAVALRHLRLRAVRPGRAARLALAGGRRAAAALACRWR